MQRQQLAVISCFPPFNFYAAESQVAEWMDHIDSDLSFTKLA